MYRRSGPSASPPLSHTPPTLFPSSSDIERPRERQSVLAGRFLNQALSCGDILEGTYDLDGQCESTTPRLGLLLTTAMSQGVLQEGPATVVIDEAIDRVGLASVRRRTPADTIVRPR